MPSFRNDSADAATLRLEGRPQRSSHGGLSVLIVGEATFATHPLPPAGDLVIGRSEQAGLRIEEASISRRHAILHVGAALTVEDLGSANGTKVGGKEVAPGEPVPVSVGDVIEVGKVTLVVQPSAAGSRPRRVWTHGYFEARVEDECARSERTRALFAVLRVHAASGSPTADIHDVLTLAMRPADVIATYGPHEYELLLLDSEPEDSEKIAREITARLATRDVHVTTGVACYPRDGRSAEELVALACHGVAGPRSERAQATQGVVIEDAAMRQLYKLVERVAAGGITVLLLGETGVGKEILAEAVHRLSPRREKPFLRLNCAALTETLLESELFGHERGAFTGAVQQKAGLLESAQGGTVFLDEIGEMALSLQVKLLRVLEQREVMRVGGLKARAIDVRFIAATNRDLEAEVQRGGFRSDLFFRLNGVSLMIPPLRERVAEIEPLARSFVVEVAKESGRIRVPKLTEAALALLKAYAWPGNIRELRNVMERAVLLAAGDEIRPEHLPVDKMTGGTLPSPARWAAGTLSPPGSGLKGEIESIEHQRILDALAACAGNQTQAAKALGISRGTLVARLERFGLPRPRKKN